jgi:peptidoglycan/LPS O-acetylase OafA/YrhL
VYLTGQGRQKGFANAFGGGLISASGSRAKPLEKPSTQHRLPHLDGLRGLAIVAVVLYHCYSRWPDVPSLYTPVFSKGFMGVQLFFLLSGFLIFMSLETSSSLLNFVYRRWLRLFPAMVVASWLIVVTSPYLYNRVEGLPGSWDALPGLLFMDPHWLRDYFHLNVTGPLEGDFWTLFTEVKFYLLFGTAFFLMRRRAVFVLAALSAGGLAVYLLEQRGVSFDSGWASRAAFAVSDELNLRCYGWFAAGAFFYLYFETGKRGPLAASVGCAAIGVAANAGPGAWEDVGFFSGVYLIFVTPFFWSAAKRFFSRRECAFFGFISYPLYLIHENTSWAILRRLNDAFPGIPDRLVPLFPIALTCGIAWLIAAFMEPMGRQLFAAGRKSKGSVPLLGGGRSKAWAALSILAAAAVTLSLLGYVRQPRLAVEAQTLVSERESVIPLEQKLAQSRQALLSVRAAREQAQAYLDSMAKAAP